MFKTDYVKQGIYFLFFKDHLQYIGKSVSVFSRIAQHEGQFDFDRVWFMSVRGDKYTLAGVEEKLIYIFAPPFNKQGIPSSKDMLLSEEERFSKCCIRSPKDILDDNTDSDGEVHNIDFFETTDGKIGLSNIVFDMVQILPPTKFNIEEIAKYVEKCEVYRDVGLCIWRELYKQNEEIENRCVRVIGKEED